MRTVVMSRHHGLSYRAVMEWTGPAAVLAVLRAGTKAGALHGPTSPEELSAGCGDHGHYAVLDLIDADDEVIGDWCIPTREAWGWWARAVELRATSAGCPDEEPAAYAVTYAFANGGPW